MKIILIFLSLLIIVVAAFFFMQNQEGKLSIFQRSKTPTAIIDNHHFTILEAKTDNEKQIGLSSRKNLPANEGMLFPFDKEAYYSFWMKDMQFPIDIIFIKKGHIVTIYQNVQPPKSKGETLIIYQSTQPADTVFEINAGLSKKYGFKNGDLVSLKNT